MRKFQNMSKHMYDRRNHENNGPNSWGKFRKFQSKNEEPATVLINLHISQNGLKMATILGHLGCLQFLRWEF